MRIERWNSVESYAQDVMSKRPGSRGRDYSYDSYGFGGGGGHYGGRSDGHDWDAGVGFDDAIQRSQAGDPSLVSKYTSMVDKLVNEFTFRDEPKNRYVPSLAGSRVSVPDYLAGSPRSMRKRAPVEMQTRSVSIYVCITCSAAIPADKMIKRGATILSLLEFLQVSQVGVELFLTAETHGRTDGDFTQIIQVQSHPLDLSTAGFAIVHPAFARQVTYAMAYWMDGFNGGWPRSRGYNYGYGSKSDSAETSSYVKLLRKELQMQPTDIYIPGPFYGDEEIMSNPETWLAKYIRQIRDGIESMGPVQ